MVMYNLFTHVLSLIQVEQELAMAKKNKNNTMTSQQEIRAMCTTIHVNVLRLICIPSKAEMVSLIPLSKLVISF